MVTVTIGSGNAMEMVTHDIRNKKIKARGQWYRPFYSLAFTTKKRVVHVQTQLRL